MIIHLTEIQYRHIEGFLHRYGFARLAAGFNIKLINLNISKPGMTLGEVKNDYTIEITGDFNINSLMDFLQHLKNI